MEYFSLEACGFYHEAGRSCDSSATFNKDITIQRVINCVKRDFGNYELCAHVDTIFPGEEETGVVPIDMVLGQRIKKMGSVLLGKRHQDLRWFKHILDDIMRTSHYPKENLPRKLEFPNFLLGNDNFFRWFEEIKVILRSCNIPIPGEPNFQEHYTTKDNRKKLNQGQRTRLNFLLKKLQESLKRYYDELTIDLVRLENNL